MGLKVVPADPPAAVALAGHGGRSGFGILKKCGCCPDGREVSVGLVKEEPDQGYAWLAR